jgi:uncharacterized protein YjdB
VLAAAAGAQAQVPSSIRVIPADRSIAIGQSKSMTAIATFANNQEQEVTDQVIWISSNPTVATVSNEPGSRGHATGRGSGVTFVSATLSGVTSSSTGGDARIRVQAGLLGIRISPPQVQIAEGFTVALDAIGFFSDGSVENITNDVRWESSNRSDIDVSNDRGSEGEVTARDTGFAIISAVDDNTGLSSSDSGGDAVVSAIGTVHHLEITPPEEALQIGDSLRFSIRAVLEDGTSFSVLRHHVGWNLSDRSVASVSNDRSTAGLVTADRPGTTVLTAFHPATRLTAEATVHVVGELVSLRVTPPDRRIDLGDTKSMTAVGTFEGGIEADVTDAVTWRSSDPGVVFVSNQSGQHGRATAVQPGEAFISARLDGASSSDTDGDARVRVPARLEAIRIVPRDVTLPVAFSTTLDAEGSFSDGSVDGISNDVVWTSSNPSVATVSNVPGSEGEVSALATGTTVISAEDPDTGLSSRQSAGDVVVTVSGRVAALSVRPLEQILPIGSERRFSVDAEIDDGSIVPVSRSDVTWQSSDPVIALVGNERATAGSVTASAPGEALISVRHEQSGVASTDSLGDALVVVPGTIQSLRVRLDDEPADDGTQLVARLIRGQTAQLAAVAVFSDGTVGDVSQVVEWNSSDATAATVTTDSGRRGLVTAQSGGQAVISVRDPFSGVVSSGVDAAVVEVRQLLSLRVTPPDRRIDLGEERSMTAVGTLAGGAEQELTDVVVWSSSNPAAVSVSNERGRRGRATAKGPGVAMISAVAPGGISSSTTGGDGRVRVPAQLLSIRVVPSSLRLPVGFASSLDAEGTFNDGSVSDISNDVVWSTSAAPIAIVSNAPGAEGEVLAVAPGTAAISAQDPESSISSTLSGGDALVEVAGRVVALEVTPSEAEVPVGFARRFSAQVRLDDGSAFNLSRRSVQWATRNSNIATVSNARGGEGTVTAVVRGETTVSALHVESGLRSATSGNDARVIVPGRLMALEVRPQERQIFVGQTKRFSAFGLLEEGGEVKISTDLQFSSHDEAIATVSNASGARGNTTGVAEGETTISVVHVPSGLSSAATGGDGVVVVAGVVSSMRVDPPRLFFLRGTKEKLTLRATLDNGRQTNVASDVVWTSSDLSVAEINDDGILIAKKFGTVTISALEPASGVTTTASGGDGTVTIVDEVERLRVLDADLQLRTGDRPRLRAVGQFRNPDPLIGEPEIQNIDLTSRAQFTSSNPSVIRIQDGRALAVGLGEAVISAVEPELGISSAATGGDTVYRVTSALRDLTIKPKKIRVRVGSGNPRSFEAIGRYTDGTSIDLTEQVEFSTADASVAEVTSKPGDRGRVIAVGKGRTAVTAVEPVTGFQATRARKIIVKKARR